MDLPLEHLRTLASAVDTGSIERAAQLLHITPSAASQRIRALEQRTGSVLLTRSRPVTVTAAGATVLRAARQIDRIVHDTAAALGHEHAGGALLPIVVNADSLATWFVPALARAARETGAHFEIMRADETIGAERLRSGEAVAALTATARAVPGCVSTLLGADRYLAVAQPSFAAEHFAHGLTAAALAAAPMLEFDRHDLFQQRFLDRTAGAGIDPPRHFIPSSAEFALAIELGMGWGMLPELQCADALAAGRLVTLGTAPGMRLPLYWQRWGIESPVLDTVSKIIAEEARAALPPTEE